MTLTSLATIGMAQSLSGGPASRPGGRAPAAPYQGATITDPSMDPFAEPGVAPPQTHGRMQLEVHRIDGSLPPAAARRVLARHTAELTRCYTSVLRTNPGTQGLMVMRLTITPTGTLSAVDEGVDYVHNADLSLCLVHRYRNIVFPAPDDGHQTIATIQMRFTPVTPNGRRDAARHRRR